MKKFRFIIFILILLFLGPLFVFAQFSCSSNGECDDQNPDTLDVCQRSGQTNSGCSNLSCVVECLADSDCSDGDDTTLDVCAGSGRCSATCSNLTLCGNGVVDTGETQCNCPQDLGACSGDAAGTCREFACVRNVCQNTLALGCCGNKICEIKEDFSNCSIDCKARSLEIEVQGISEGDYYIRGEEILIKVIVTADGVAVKNAEVDAEGFFGSLNLSNDGKHNDNLKGDNVYANTLIIPQNIEADIYPITINTVFENNRGIKTINLTVDPKLEIRLNVDSEKVFLGDPISVSGVISKKETAIKSNVTITVYSNDISVARQTIATNDLGEFSFSYRTSFLDNEGEWRVEAFSKDSLENIGFVEKTVEVAKSEITAFLSVALAKEINASYVRGEEMFLSISVVDGDEIIVNEAQINVSLPNGVQIVLEETDEGLYEGNIEIGLDFPLGEQEIRINALKSDGNNFFAGSTTIEFVVEKTDIIIEITSPKIRSVQVGQSIEFVVTISYPNKKPVILSKIESTVNGKKIVLNAQDQGVYVANYVVEPLDAPNLSFEVLVDDSFGNIASIDLEIEVSGISIEHYFRRTGFQLIALVIVLGFMGVVLFSVFSKKRKLFNLQKEEKKSLDELKRIQEEYFKDGTLDRKNYDRQMEKFELKLEDARKSIAQLEEKNSKQEPV